MARTPKIPKAQEAPGPRRPPHRVLLPKHIQPVFMMLVTCLPFGPVQIVHSTWGVVRCQLGERDVTDEVNWMVEHGFLSWSGERRRPISKMFQSLDLTQKGIIYSKIIGLDLDAERTEIKSEAVQRPVDVDHKSSLWATYYKVGRPHVERPSSEKLYSQLRAYRNHLASQVFKQASVCWLQNELRSLGVGDDVDAGGEKEGA